VCVYGYRVCQTLKLFWAILHVTLLTIKIQKCKNQRHTTTTFELPELKHSEETLSVNEIQYNSGKAIQIPLSFHLQQEILPMKSF
jgi:hypothetical protein